MPKRYVIPALVLCATAGALAYGLLAPQEAADNPAANAPALPRLAYVSPPVPKAPPLAAGRTPAQGLEEFRSEFYRFQLLHADEFSTTLIKEKGSAATIVFESAADSGRDFQIFVVPYGAPQVSEARFKLDQSSGIMEEPRDMLVDGTAARFFYGRNAAMGDTAEIWFINKGFLYEVTTYKANGAWLAEALKGWMFL